MDTATGMFKDIAVGRITNLINTYIDDQWEYQCTTNVKHKLEVMNSSFTAIKSLLDVAERREIEENESLVQWLSELKKAIYNAEYVIDIFEYKRLKHEVDNYPENKVEMIEDKSGGNNKVHYYSKVLSACCFKIRENATIIAKRLVFADDDLNDLLQVVIKLNNLVAGMNNIFSILNSYPEKQHRAVRQDTAGVDRIPSWRETTSVPAETELFGRDEVQEELLEKLLQSSDETSDHTRNLSVVSVVGVGGVGKTTLAQSVFNDQRVKDCFEVRAWACVSNNFNSKSLIVRIVESAEIEKPNDFHTLHSLEGVQKFLMRGLKSKKFLIVLDDVWEDMEEKWEHICAPFHFGEKGSKILVTSRFREVAKVMGAQDNMQIDLKPLESEQFLDFFQKCAFGDKKPEEHPRNLKMIGKKIAEKLGGLPLAAKTVGALLRQDLKTNHWNSVLDNEGWKTHKSGTVMSALKVSYDYLPKHLQKCFVYCCLFPKDYQYKAETLVDIWSTLDCVTPEDKNKRLVDIQGEYIHCLVSRCFLENSSEGIYVMHDLLHDLADQIAGHEVYRIENDDSLFKKEPQTHSIRHLHVESTTNGDLNSVLQKLKIPPKQLRSLIYVAYNEISSEEGESKIFEEIIPMLKGLRLLLYSGRKQMELGENIGDLLHLRCINLDLLADTFVFPTSFWKLHQIEIFRLEFSGKVKECVGLHKLINLRYFEQNGRQHYDPEIITSHLSRLKFLEVVPGGKFTVDSKEGNGNDIGQLGNLNKIGGKLTLRVQIKFSEQEATKANLKRKKYLTELTINEKCADEEGGIQDNTVATLQPHEDLQNLKIKGCKSITKVPDWLFNLSTLTILHLLNLPNLQRLPPDLGCNLPVLEELHIGGLPLVNQIDVVCASSSELFPSLKFIEIHDMVHLEGWSLHICNQTTEIFPKISRIVICKCPKFLIKGSALDCYGFPFSPPNCNIRVEFGSLCTFSVDNMIEMDIDVESLSPVTDDNIGPRTSLWFKHIKEMIVYSNLPVNMMMLNLFPSLELLQFKGCDQGIALHHSNSIEKLIIENCWNSKFLLADNNGLQTFSSLRTLIIQDCNNLQSIQASSSDDNDELIVFPPCINKVIIKRCPKLKLPRATLQMINSSSSSIHTLLIEGCWEIEKSTQYRAAWLYSFYTFNVVEVKGIRNRIRVDGEEGDDIEQLRWINEIRGELTLDVDVKLSMKEAENANLYGKKQLRLIIKENEDGAIEAEAMEALRPHRELKMLKIDGCKTIITPPTWLSMHSELTELELCNLPKLEGIPSHLGYHLWRLQKLHLISIPCVKQIHVAVDDRQPLRLFPSLVYVKMSNMINFDGWSLDSCSNQITENFSRLSTIEIFNCPMLLKECHSPDCIIFPLPSSNCNVKLVLYPDDYHRDEENHDDDVEMRMIGVKIDNDDDVEEMRMIGMKIDVQSLAPIADDNNNSKTSMLFNYVKEMTIIQIKNLMDKVLRAFSSLETLIIKDCNELESLDNIVHHHLSAASCINKLIIKKCDKLKLLSAASIFPSLETLIIEDCTEIKSLTNDNQLLSNSVKTLIIKRCPRLNILFLRLLPSLETLAIEDCKEIEVND